MKCERLQRAVVAVEAMFGFREPQPYMAKSRTKIPAKF